MTSPETSPQDRAIDALMGLLDDKPWNTILLPEIAARAQLSLAELRKAFPSKGAILGAFSRRIDVAMLGEGEDMAARAAEPTRERLFDVVMRRFDALQPYKKAIRNAAEDLMRDPLAAVELNRMAVNSAQWMLAAAGLRESGPAGAIKAQALSVIVARVTRTWLDDDEPGLSRTMRVLDEQLERAERLARAGDGFARMCRPLFRMLDRRPRPRDERRPPDTSSEDFMPAI